MISLSHKMILVIGAYGFLGSRLFKFFSWHQGAVGLSHSRLNPGSGNIETFDLQDPDWSVFERVALRAEAAIICSAINGFDQCKRDPVLTQLINVTRITESIERLERMKIFPIYLSSDAVFEGSRGDYREEDERNPLTVYGRQKKEVEDFLMSRASRSLIVRLGKVFDVNFRDGTLFTAWLDSFLEGQAVSCAVDQHLAPIYVGDVVEGVNQLLSRKETGVFHLCGTEKQSRYELAVKLATSFGYPPNIVKQSSINDFPLLERRPSYQSLNVDKFIRVTGLTPKPFRDSFEKIAANYLLPIQL